MIAIGLIPSANGQPGGKQTGQRMDHYIDPAGAFAIHTQAMITSGFVLRWQAKRTTRENGDAPEGTGDETENNPKNKIKYTCSTCGQNAWAKLSARLICGDCDERMLVQE
jgi:DNA-directed RNA polymerase subunit RPC12/RpoP